MSISHGLVDPSCEKKNWRCGRINCFTVNWDVCVCVCVRFVCVTNGRHNLRVETTEWNVRSKTEVVRKAIRSASSFLLRPTIRSPFPALFPGELSTPSSATSDTFIQVAFMAPPGHPGHPRPPPAIPGHPRQPRNRRGRNHQHPSRIRNEMEWNEFPRQKPTMWHAPISESETRPNRRPISIHRHPRVPLTSLPASA